MKNLLKNTVALFFGLTLSLSALVARSNTISSNSSTTMSHGHFTPAQIKNIESIVHDYLIKNPQVLVEVSEELQKQTEEKEMTLAKQAIKNNLQKIFYDPNSPVAGNPNGSVVLVEFFDYQCGHCREMSPLMQDIVSKNKNLKVIFKELPIFGANSKLAAEAALASVQQGKYYPFHNELFAAENPLSKQQIYRIAKKAGLNISKLRKEMSSNLIKQQISKNMQLAQALHLVGTPSFILSNKSHTQFEFIPGATSETNLQDKIDELSQSHTTN